MAAPETLVPKTTRRLSNTFVHDASGCTNTASLRERLNNPPASILAILQNQLLLPQINVNPQFEDEGFADREDTGEAPQQVRRAFVTQLQLESLFGLRVTRKYKRKNDDSPIQTSQEQVRSLVFRIIPLGFLIVRVLGLMQSKMMSRKSESLVARSRSAQGEKYLCPWAYWWIFSSS